MLIVLALGDIIFLWLQTTVYNGSLALSLLLQGHQLFGRFLGSLMFINNTRNYMDVNCVLLPVRHTALLTIYLSIYSFEALGIEPKALHTLSKHTSTLVSWEMISLYASDWPRIHDASVSASWMWAQQAYATIYGFDFLLERVWGSNRTHVVWKCKEASWGGRVQVWVPWSSKSGKSRGEEDWQKECMRVP